MNTSLKRIFKDAGNAILRFPFAILFGILVATCFSWSSFLPFGSHEELEELLLDLGSAGFLGMLSGIFFPLLGKNRLLPKNWGPLWHFFSPLVFVIYFITLPEGIPREGYHDAIHFTYFLLVLAFHFGIAFAPFIKEKDLFRFWHFNKTLFLRILTSALYSGVLFVGLSIAILAFDELFGFHIEDEIYFSLWFFLTGVFNTWFFVAGIPKEPKEMDPNAPYPKGLKMFTQYVLLPLVTIYLIILYLYVAKVLIQWELPQGWTAYLVLSFSIVGVLALLLLFPIQGRKENKWIELYSKGFHISIFPLIILLGVAISERILQYGITENRYFVIVLALWLFGTALYFTISKKPNIKGIPVSLFFLCILVSFGPWSAFSISEMDQRNRLSGYLERAGALDQNGKARAIPDTASFETVDEIRKKVGYLLRVHGSEGVQPLIREDLDSLFKADSIFYYYQQEDLIMELLGKEGYYGGGHTKYNRKNYKKIKISVENPVEGLDVEEFDRLFHFKANYSRNDSTIREFVLHRSIIITGTLRRTNSPELTLRDQDTTILELPLDRVLNETLKNNRRSSSYISKSKGIEEMTWEFVGPYGNEWTVLIQHIDSETYSNVSGLRILNLSAMIFLNEQDNAKGSGLE